MIDEADLTTIAAARGSQETLRLSSAVGEAPMVIAPLGLGGAGGLLLGGEPR